MDIQQRFTIDAPIEKVWKTLAEDFGHVDQWATSVHRSNASGTLPSKGSQRSCDTDFGKFHETVVQYDEVGKQFAYRAQGGPPLMKQATNRWTLRNSRGGTEVSMHMTMELLPVIGFVMGPLMRWQMGKALTEAGQELKHFVETGRPHPRKKTSVAKLRRKGKFQPKAASSALAAAALLSAGLLAGGVEAQDPNQPIPPRMVGSFEVDRATAAPLQVIRSARLEAKPAKVFDLLADQQHWTDWFPAIQSVRLEKGEAKTLGDAGTLRRITLADGASLTERVVGFEEPTSTSSGFFAYAIQPNNPMGLRGHVAVMEVRGQGKASVLTWHQFFDHAQPDAISQGITGIMDDVLQNLVGRFGGERLGGVSGVGTLEFTLHRTVSTPASHTWEVVGEGFGNVDDWASVISHAQLERPTGGWVGAQRSCDTALGGFQETVLTFDEESRQISYQAVGLPPVVAKAVNSWTIIEDGPRRSRIDMVLRMDMVPGAGAQVAGGMKPQMLQVLEVTLDDLQYYLEQGRPHPRKLASIGR